ncbi:MAG: transglycosylase domain-containing protein [Pseudomonadota bacterium]
MSSPGAIGRHKALISLGSATLLALLWLYWFVLRDLPPAADVVEFQPAASGQLLARDGELLFRLFEEEDRLPVTLASLPRHLIDAVLAIEDQDFYSHWGFSPAGMARALRNNFTGSRSLEGGSTITQQLVKNRVLGSEKTIPRKLKELILAMGVERLASKDEILEMYLNQVAFGGVAYGVEAAARSYFDKPASALTLNESAFLAGLLRAPSTYSPFVGTQTAHLGRKRVVLQRMLDEGWISQHLHDQARDEPLVFSPTRTAIRAPHFALYVRQLLIDRYGENRVHTEGLRVRTSLDWPLQQEVQRQVTGTVNRLFRYWVGNGAALVTRPLTGEILSMVGSADFYDKEAEGEVNIALALRQPGSSIKPLTYAMSLQGGKTPVTLLSDTPIELEIPEEGNYAPRNIDYEFRGDVTLRQALAASRNIPAVNELVLIGVRNYIEKAQTLGIDTWQDQNDFRFALTLGSGEVRMLDMMHMYSTFPNLGYAVAPDPILSIEDRYGNVIYERECVTAADGCVEDQDFDPGVAFLVNDILSDNEARSATFGPGSDLEVGNHSVAVKTGTTDELRDNWTIGYTSDRLVAVWIGNNDNSPMRFIHSGTLGASTIWNAIMQHLLESQLPHRFPIPEDIVSEEVCLPAGTLGCATCAETRYEYFVRGSAPDTRCQ